MPHDAVQADVIEFLGSAAAWPNAVGLIGRIETHGALVFMAGDTTLKIRRAVRLPYLDFSTLDARRKFAEREVALNAAHAPGLYRGVVGITREADGALAVGGSGRVVEWAVQMARFSQDALLSEIVKAAGITDALARALADAVFEYHASAPVVADGVDRVAGILQSVMGTLAAGGDARLSGLVADVALLAERVLQRSAGVRAERARAGFIRRCHGDLHLGNIVLWRTQPVPFDAIEFDEAIATIDTLYDLAFLLMDLDRNHARRSANIVLNQYLWRSGDRRDVTGLAAMPLYLALRAAIRAMVGLDRARLGVGDQTSEVTLALAILADAKAYLTPGAVCLVAVGGLSGTGKTTLAAALAPSIGVAPGAVHLRTDLERKWLAGVQQTQRLPPSSYTRAASKAAYDRVMTRANCALKAGHSVIVDAVFADPAERASIEALAGDCGAKFHGIWLTGDPELLKARVALRTGDASDATPDIVQQQLDYRIGLMTWTSINASGSAETVADTARSALHER